jgi:leucyl-tRNA synthetase
MFQSPPEQTLEWQDTAVEGASRFLRSLWRLVFEHLEHGPAPALDVDALGDEQKRIRRATHTTIAKVSDDIGRRYKFNTAIAAVMELLNTVRTWKDSSDAGRAVRQEALENAVLLLSPIVPHITHTLWSALQREGAIVDASWPAADESALTSDTLTLVVQVNGKRRDEIEVWAAADNASIEATALGNEKVQRTIGGKAVRKVIVVPGRLVNIVI